MSLLYRRYRKSRGYTPGWLYVAFTAGFIALTSWAAVSGDWLVAGIGAALSAATLGMVPLTRRLARGLEASARQHGGVAAMNGGPDE